MVLFNKESGTSVCLYGIPSFAGPNCSDPSQPGVSSRVQFYLENETTLQLLTGLKFNSDLVVHTDLDFLGPSITQKTATETTTTTTTTMTTTTTTTMTTTAEWFKRTSPQRQAKTSPKSEPYVPPLQKKMKRKRKCKNTGRSASLGLIELQIFCIGCLHVHFVQSVLKN